MTKNQSNLIIFINNYHIQHGVIPSLGEMVKGINVSANNSVLRAIEALVNKGYLAQVGAKASSVIPTYKALKELGLQSLEKYTIIGDTNKTEFANNISFNGATSLQNDLVPPFHSVQNAESKIKTEGTQFDSNTLQTLVQSYVNLALEKYIPEKIPLNRQSELTISAIILLGFSVKFMGTDYKAIVATCGILFTIFIITNLSK
ncbi:MAG: hypothetical protein WA063_02760 [Minisyncoccia bacterium]